MRISYVFECYAFSISHGDHAQHDHPHIHHTTKAKKQNKKKTKTQTYIGDDSFAFIPINHQGPSQVTRVSIQDLLYLPDCGCLGCSLCRVQDLSTPGCATAEVLDDGRDLLVGGGGGCGVDKVDVKLVGDGCLAEEGQGLGRDL